MSCVHAKGQFHGKYAGLPAQEALSPSFLNPSSNISLVYSVALTAAFSSPRGCLPPLM